MSRSTPPAPGRILVRAPNWVGDVVMSTPGLRALREAFPAATLTVMLPAPLAPLLEGSRDVDAVWGLPAGRAARLRFAWQRVRPGRFDLGLVIPESISSALEMRVAGIPRIVGTARDGLRRLLLHETVPTPPDWGRRRFVSKQRFVARLVQAIGAPVADLGLHLAVSDDERARFETQWAIAGGATGHAIPSAPVLLAPGAGYGDSKCWPVESFAALGDALREQGESVWVVGSPSEQARCNRVVAASRAGLVSLAGTLDLGTFKALVSSARLLVGNDAGARHVAAAFGVPQLVFFGPTAVEKTDDGLERTTLLETEHGCRPCYRRRCPIDHRCLRSIGVKEALAAIERSGALGSSGLAGNESGDLSVRDIEPECIAGRAAGHAGGIAGGGV